jgi:RNA polymerase-interacting CarD/CdnL/TRCF family regulator
MLEQNSPFQVGDEVIHWVYGLGEIVRIEEKVLFGHIDQYYVLQTRDLTLWVPLNETGERYLRFPTPESDFQNLFRLLASPGVPLSKERLARRTQLAELLKGRTLESTCRVVRDLVCHKRTNRLNENDNTILKRARNFLLNEWSAILSVPIYQADSELKNLLATSVV